MVITLSVVSFEWYKTLHVNNQNVLKMHEFVGVWIEIVVVEVAFVSSFSGLEQVSNWDQNTMPNNNQIFSLHFKLIF